MEVEEEINSPDWSDINKVFGNTVASYLKEHQCKIHKSKTGAYFLSENDRHIFNDCVHLVRNQSRPKKKITKINEIPVREIPYKPETVDLEGEDNIRLFEGFRRTLDFVTTNENNSLSCSYPESTQASSQPSTSRNTTNENMNTENYAMNHKNLNEQNYRVHRRFKNINNNEIIFENLFRILKNGYEESIPIFKPIVKSFIEKHRSFKYNIFLNSIPQDKSLLDGQLSNKQVNFFFNQIFYKVVPISLFGNRRNLKKIQSFVRNFLRAADGEYFSAKKLVYRLDRKCIAWLNKIEKEEAQLIFLLNVIQWFFENFVLGLINTYFYTEKNTSIKQKSFFRRWKKNATALNYINQQVRLTIFKPVDLCNVTNDSIPVADLILHTKKDGVRPILSTVPSPERKKERQLIKGILRQLYLRNHDVIRAETIHKIWRSFAETYVNPQETPLYFVSCDVSDAYGSVIQKKLLKIIYDRLDELPDKDKLVSRWFIVLNPQNLAKYDGYKDSLAPDSLPVMLPPGTLCCLDTKVKKFCRIVKVEALKKRLECYILKQKIHVNGQCYILKQGVGQGLPMSSVLCDFYYGDMIVNEFSEFSEHGHILRYVDDILYLTTCEKAARKFLKKINNGVKSYNCTFKQRKTQSNLEPYRKEEFVYLGYRFNIKTLSVVPEYSTAPVRYSIAISRPPNNLLNTFVLRIANPQGLKLCSLIMDSSINSQEVILNTLKRASTLSAQRCLVLLINMFDLQDFDNLKLFKIMKNRCVQPLLTKFKKLIMNNRKKDFKISWVQLKLITWSAYSEVFRRNTSINRLFIRLIKSQYKKIIQLPKCKLYQQ